MAKKNNKSKSTATKPVQNKYADYHVGQLRPVNNRETKGHTGYMITKTGSGANAKFGYVSMTHSKTYKDQKTKKIYNNIPLTKNPDNTDIDENGKLRQVYAIDKSKTEQAKKIGKIKKGWRLTRRDKKMLRRIYYKNKK